MLPRADALRARVDASNAIFLLADAVPEALNAVDGAEAKGAADAAQACVAPMYAAEGRMELAEPVHAMVEYYLQDAGLPARPAH